MDFTPSPIEYIKRVIKKLQKDMENDGDDDLLESIIDLQCALHKLKKIM